MGRRERVTSERALISQKGILPIVLLILLFVGGSFAHAAADSSPIEYLIKVQENGNTMTTIHVQEQTIFIPLPPDIITPQIENGRYESTESGIIVTAEQQARITYTSAQSTWKDEGLWHLEMEAAENSKVQLIFPPTVKIVQARPRPHIAKDQELELRWDDVSGTIALTYVFMGNEEPAGDAAFSSTTRYFAIGLGVIVLVLLAWYYSKHYRYRQKKEHLSSPNLKKEGVPELNITDGQMNILRAANENEALVLRIILRHNGHIKRNTLEKETSLPKSSLASALHNLEKKNIVVIDRTFHVHYLTLSSWFKQL